MGNVASIPLMNYSWPNSSIPLAVHVPHFSLLQSQAMRAHRPRCTCNFCVMLCSFSIVNFWTTALDANCSTTCGSQHLLTAFIQFIPLPMVESQGLFKLPPKSLKHWEHSNSGFAKWLCCSEVQLQPPAVACKACMKPRV